MMIAQTLPPEVCSIVVPAISDGSQICVLGFSLKGTDAELDEVVKVATLHGLRTSRRATPGQPSEQYVAFIPGTSMADVAAMLASSRNGSFGKAVLQVMVTPQATAGDGIDMATETGYADPSALKLPTQ